MDGQIARPGFTGARRIAVAVGWIHRTSIFRSPGAGPAAEDLVLCLQSFERASILTAGVTEIRRVAIE